MRLWLFSVGLLICSACASDRRVTEGSARNHGAAGPVSGLALVSGRDEYRSVAITGKVTCQARAALDSSLPCRGLSIFLADQGGKTLATLKDVRNEFLFRVASGTAYRLRVESSDFETRNSLDGEVFQGDDLIISLIRKVAQNDRSRRVGSK